MAETSENGPFVRTLIGDIRPDELGFTLPHEHVYCDFAESTGDPDLSFSSAGAILADLRQAAAWGVETIVEVSTYDMGADPLHVFDLCKRARLRAVKSTGWFRAPSLDPMIARSDPQALAARAIADIRSGFEGSHMRAGVIGEIGISGFEPTPAERVALAATATAARVTGAGVVAHSDDWANARAIVDLLTGRGVAADRIMLAHCRCADPIVGLHELARAGMTLAFDQLGHPRRDPVEAVAARIAELIEAGFGEQLVVSADVGRRSRLRSEGGRGYVRGVQELLASLRTHGYSQDTLDRLSRVGPARFLAFSDPGGSA